MPHGSRNWHMRMTVARAVEHLHPTLARLRARRGPEALVLMYHRICTGEARAMPEPELAVRATTFEHHLAFLRQHCHLVPLSALTDGSLPAGNKPVVALTFDDGWRDNYHLALPLLQRFSAPATVFITTGFIGTSRRLWSTELAVRWPRLVTEGHLPWLLGALCAAGAPLPEGRHLATRAQATHWLGLLPPEGRERVVAELAARVAAPPHEPEFMTWSEVQELAAAGIEIGAHTVDHASLAALPPEAADRQLRESKRAVEAQLGRECWSFAYPGGSWSEAVRARVQAAGFRLAVTTQEGTWRAGTDLLGVPRVAVDERSATDPSGRFRPELFALEISGLWRGLRRMAKRRPPRARPLPLPSPPPSCSISASPASNSPAALGGAACR